MFKRILMLIIVVATPLLTAAANEWQPTTSRFGINPADLGYSSTISKIPVDPIRQMTCESYGLGQNPLGIPTPNNVVVMCYDPYRVYWSGIQGAAGTGRVNLPAGTSTQSNQTTEGTVSIRINDRGQILSGSFVEAQAPATSASLARDGTIQEVVLAKGGFEAAVYANDQVVAGPQPVIVGTSSGAQQISHTSSQWVYRWQNQTFTIHLAWTGPFQMQFTLS